MHWLKPAILAQFRPNLSEARGRGAKLSVGPNGLSCEATETDGSPMRRSNKAFKLTRSHGLCRMEALRATMRRLSGPSQLNAMLGRPHE
jgi:hypothetical protein